MKSSTPLATLTTANLDRVSGGCKMVPITHAPTTFVAPPQPQQQLATDGWDGKLSPELEQRALELAGDIEQFINEHAPGMLDAPAAAPAVTHAIGLMSEHPEAIGHQMTLAAPHSGANDKHHAVHEEAPAAQGGHFMAVAETVEAAQLPAETNCPSPGQVVDMHQAVAGLVDRAARMI